MDLLNKKGSDLEKKLKILIVEDEALIANWLKMELEILGFNICGLSASGEESVQMALDLKPDVILMDVFLHGDITGIEAVQEIKKLSDVRIIFMTGYHDEHIKKTIIDLNPTAILIKPVKPETVAEILAKI